MIRLFFILLITSLLTGCTHKWTAYPQGIKDYEKCQTFRSGPQMLKVQNYNSYIMVPHCSIMDTERVSIGITIFLQEWRKSHRLGFKHNVVEKTMNNLLIEFNDIDKRVYSAFDINGEKLNDVAVVGLAISPTMAWIKTVPGERLCTTSFAHELMHLAIWNIKLSHNSPEANGDPDHLGPSYYGWSIDSNAIIDRTNERLCQLGI